MIEPMRVFLLSAITQCLILTAASLGSVILSSACYAEDPIEPRNVLFIAVDDLNDWVGILGGHPQAVTPNIDRLAQRGLLFRNAHCSAPGCNASRTSLLMGLRPSTTGIYKNAHDWRTTHLAEDAVHLPQHFRNHGYLTLGAGKLFHAHTFFDAKYLSGFSDPKAWDDYFPSLTQQMPAEITPDEWPVNSNPEFYGGHFDWAALDIEESEMADAKVVDWAKQQLGRAHDRPLFLSVGIYRPHVPWYVPREFFEKFPLASIQLPVHMAGDIDDLPEAAKEMAKLEWHEWIVANGQWKKAVQGYLASLAFADEMVGQLLDALDNGPMANNTTIILWGDHGYHLGEKQHWEKFALWESTTHVPLIVVSPGQTSPQTQCDSPVSLLDLYPTLVDLCGFQKPPQQIEGESLVRFFQHPNLQTDRVAITTQGMGNHSIRSKRYRYIVYADGSEELYDHETDPHEWKNLAGDSVFAPVIQKLAKYLPVINHNPITVPGKSAAKNATEPQAEDADSKDD
ncbi:MAG: sulfatase [Rubripirellula sp.]|nr:sulfatase [Rubripirellula sp.]